MTTLIIGNQTDPAQLRERVLQAWQSGEPEPAARLDFANLDEAFKILSPKRRAILEIMAGGENFSIREIARRLNRDVRAVHSDTQILLRNGVLDRTAQNRLTLPYSTIKFDFSIQAKSAA